MNIIDILSEGLLAGWGQRPPQDRHYFSDVLSCPRKRWYSFHGQQESNPQDYAGAIKPEIGKAFEAILRTAIGRHPRGYDQIEQFPIYEKPDGCSRILSGKCDFLISAKEDPANREEMAAYIQQAAALRDVENFDALLGLRRPQPQGYNLVELKTCAGTEAKFLQKDGPRESYVAQLALYIYFLWGEGEGWILYLTREFGYPIRYRVTVADGGVHVDDGLIPALKIENLLDDFRAMDTLVDGPLPGRPSGDLYDIERNGDGSYKINEKSKTGTQAGGKWPCHVRYCKYSDHCLKYENDGNR